MKIPNRIHQNYTTTHLYAPELYTCKTRGESQKPTWHSGRVQDCRRDIPSSNPDEDKKKISHMTHQNYNTTNPLLTTVKFPEIVLNRKSLWQSGRVQDQRSSGDHLKSQCRQKENLSQVQSEQYYYQFLCIRVKLLTLSEEKTRSYCSTLVECKTRDLEVQILLWTKKISQIQSEQYSNPISLHKSKITEIVRSVNPKWMWISGKVQKWSSLAQIPVQIKGKSLTEPFRIIPPPIPLN